MLATHCPHLTRNSLLPCWGRLRLRSVLVGSAWPARTSGPPRPCFACFLFMCAPQCYAQVFRPCTALHRPGLPGFFFLSRFARPGQLLPRKAGHFLVVKARRSRLFAAVPPTLIPALPAQVSYAFFELFPRTYALHRCALLSCCTRFVPSFLCIETSSAALLSIFAFCLVCIAPPRPALLCTATQWQLAQH